jgi:mRNA-degrading endonuclease RelE of RelBE toxin-antitoxin system
VGVISIDEKLGPTYRLRREGIQDQKVYEQELIEEQENTPKPEVILFKEPRSAVIVKSNQEIAVAGEVTKNGQRFVKPSKGEDIPKDEVEYLEDAKIHQGMEVTLVLKPGKDEPKYTVQEVYLDTSVPQYPYGVVLVGLKANDSSAEFQEMDVTYAHLSSSNKLIAPPEALAEWRREKSAESSEKSTTTQEPPKPKPKEGSQESPESSKTEFKFKHGDEVRVRNQDTGEWQIRKVNKSFVGNEDKVYVRYIDPSGKEPEKHIPEWLLERWNPRPASQTETEKDDKQQQGGNGPPDNKANKVKNNENPWLDPRFILQIKEKFEKALKKHADTRKRLNDETSEHFITVLRTGIIQEAVTDRISRDKWLAGTGPTGDSRQYGFEAMPRHNKDLSPEELEEVKSQIATMMDNLSYEELSKMAEKAEENLEKLKPYFNHGGKVKLPNGTVINGRVGYSTTKHKVYIARPEGKWKWIHAPGNKNEPYLVDVKEFLDWQNLKTTEEEMKPYAGKDVNYINSEGEALNGRAEYFKRKNKIRFITDSGEKLTLNADRYLAYHKWVDKKLEKIDREVPANERNFVLGQKVRIIRNGAIEEGWRVDDFEKSTNVYGKSDPKITLIKNGREWKVEQSTLENFKKAPDDYGTVTTPPVATATT